jgi:hypothetical protein
MAEASLMWAPVQDGSPSKQRAAGTVVVGTERESQSLLDRLLAQLDAQRMGGHYWKDGHLHGALMASGFEELEEFSLVEPLLLVAGSRRS